MACANQAPRHERLQAGGYPDHRYKFADVCMTLKQLVHSASQHRLPSKSSNYDVGKRSTAQSMDTRRGENYCAPDRQTAVVLSLCTTLPCTSVRKNPGTAEVYFRLFSDLCPKVRTQSTTTDCDTQITSRMPLERLQLKRRSPPLTTLDGNKLESCCMRMHLGYLYSIYARIVFSTRSFKKRKPRSQTGISRFDSLEDKDGSTEYRRHDGLASLRRSVKVKFTYSGATDLSELKRRVPSPLIKTQSAHEQRSYLISTCLRLNFCFPSTSHFGGSRLLSLCTPSV